MRIQMKKYMILWVLALVMFFYVLNAYAEKKCAIKEGTMLALSTETLDEAIQLKKNNDKDAIRKLFKESRLFEFPKEFYELKGEIPIDEIKECNEGKFCNIVLFSETPFQTEYWVLKEDLNCFELVDLSDIDFFPLAVGNVWEYKIIQYTNDGTTDRTVQEKITGKVENDDGSVTFFNNDTPYYYKFKEAIADEDGLILMKLPLKHGLVWQSKGGFEAADLFVQDVGFIYDLNGVAYQGCIRIIMKSDYLELAYVEVGYDTYEGQYIYAPNVGLLQTDYYGYSRAGNKKTHLSSKQLMSFKTGQALMTNKKEMVPKNNLVKPVHSFRFPEKGFSRPVLSPDEKWLVFKSDADGEKLYYTEANKADKHVLPVFPKDTVQNDDKKTTKSGIASPYSDAKSIWKSAWSPDSKILVVEIELGYDKYISVVDFSKTAPELIETFEGKAPVFAKYSGDLLYLDKYDNIEKKKPGSPREHLVFVRSNYKGNHKIRSFQVAENGALLYKTEYPRNVSVFLTNLQNPGHKTLLYKLSGKVETRINGVKLSDRFDLSPNGKYALFYFLRSQDNPSESASLLDLNTKEIIMEFPYSFQQKPAWSPDGNMLAYLGKSQSEMKKQNWMGMASNNPHLIVYDILKGENSDLGVTSTNRPNWAPDNAHLLCGSRIKHNETSAYTQFEGGIFLVDLNGVDIGHISSVRYGTERPIISFSGKYIIWGSGDSDTFFIVKNPYQTLMKQSQTIGAESLIKGVH